MNREIKKVNGIIQIRLTYPEWVKAYSLGARFNLRIFSFIFPTVLKIILKESDDRYEIDTNRPYTGPSLKATEKMSFWIEDNNRYSLASVCPSAELKITKKDMENKEIYKVKVGKEVRDVVIGDESVKLVFEDSDIEFSTFHDSDCCEDVYGDFSVMKYHKESLVGKKIEGIVVKSVKEMGFLLCFESDFNKENVKIFIACYNFQNGFYSSELSLVVKNGEVSTKVDISDAVEDHLD